MTKPGVKQNAEKETKQRYLKQISSILRLEYIGTLKV